MITRRHMMVAGGALLIGGGGAGCMSISNPDRAISLDRLLAREDMPRFTLPSTSHGRMIITMTLPNGRDVRMVVDTGATRSALYGPEWDALTVNAQPPENIRIFGMISTAVHPVKQVETVMIGNYLVEQATFARLPKPKFILDETIPHEGILGMDILINFHFYFDGPMRELRLVPREFGRLSPPTSWRIARLTSNPFLEDGRDLHFLKLRIGNTLMDGLLDTGSELNLMNWNTDRFPRLRAVRRQLKERWELQGAIGEFSPSYRVTANNFRAGQKSFSRSEFIVLDFETLNVLGIDGRPFVILGAEALKSERYILDFQNDFIAFEPRDGDELWRRAGT